MNPDQTSKLLKSIGLSSTAILLVTVVAVSFYGYKNYYETVKLKYEIARLKQLLLIGAHQNQNVNPNIL